jgi:group II intron reverse transcriptase/maturase
MKNPILNNQVVIDLTKPMKGSSLTASNKTIPAGLVELEALIKSNNNNSSPNLRVFNLVKDINVLILAYTLIKSKPGNITPGVDNLTLDGVSKEYFIKLSKDLSTGSFQFTPSRRVNIPKSNNPIDTRPLSVASPRDKIVQKSMELVISSVFEPSFLESSHGFRPNKSCHSALRQIKLSFKGNWFIEGDISKCFDSLDHRVIINLVQERIIDKPFIDLLYKALKAGYVEQFKFFNTYLGTPQGSIISPILSNIYLHNLDLFIAELKMNYDKGKRRKTNPLYTKLCRNKDIVTIRRLHLPLGLSNDPIFKRLYYVRYADSFLISLVGTKEEAIIILDLVSKYLEDKLKLKINLQKSKITHARDEKAYFLGHDIRVTPNKLKPIRINAVGTKTRVDTRVQLLAPIDKIIDSLIERKIVNNNRKPIRWGRIIHFENHRIVQLYKIIFNGITNFYSLADNYSRLHRIQYLLQYGCALTLASKNKLKTLKRTFNKYSMNLNIKDGNNKIIASFPNISLEKSNRKITMYTVAKSIAKQHKLL